MYNNIMKRVQIYLTELEIKEIKKIIKNNGGGTKSDIIRRAVDEYINKFYFENLIFIIKKNINTTNDFASNRLSNTQITSIFFIYYF